MVAYVYYYLVGYSRAAVVLLGILPGNSTSILPQLTKKDTSFILEILCIWLN